MIQKFKRKPKFRLFDYEWERMLELDAAEETGRRIGVFLHYLFVIPFRILQAMMLVLIFFLVNINHIATVLVFVLLVGGLGYVVLTIGGNLP